MKSQQELSGWAGNAGKILYISYPILAISTAFRGVYQLCCKEGVTAFLGPQTTVLAAIMYALATIGFGRREKWAWWLSVVLLTIETIFTLIIGTVSLVNPELIGSSVWRLYGIDYAFFPLLQPILGLIWLLHPTIRKAYN
jgi:hypothetical protein